MQFFLETFNYDKIIVILRICNVFPNERSYFLFLLFGNIAFELTCLQYKNLIGRVRELAC